MKSRRLLSTIVVLSLLCGLTGVAAAGRHHSHYDTIDGSGKLETRTFDLQGFDRVRLDAGMDIDVRVGKPFALELKMDDNLFENLILKVDGDELVIGWEKSCAPDDDTLLKIDLPALAGFEVNGAGEIGIAGLSGKRFEYELNGACNLELEGTVDELEIDLSGAGDIDAVNLKARSAKVNVSGAGNVDCWASEEIRAEINGVGKITYGGKPAKQKTSVHGIGSIDAR